MRAVFRYTGSKWSIADWIIQHFPAGYERMVYLEPFAGSAAVFFNKRQGTVETINDLDSNIVNLFYVLREKPEELKRMLELTPYSREEYQQAAEPSEEPVEKARRFIVRTVQAIGAKPDSGWRNHKQMKIGGTACKWGSITDTLEAASKRLRGDPTHLVQIEHMDALRLIARYDSPDVLMYLDPPYVRSTRKTRRLYKHEMDDARQLEMLQLISRSRAKIILSGYPSKLYDDHLPGWITDSTTTHTTSSEIVTEKIWMNYDPPAMQVTLDEVCKGYAARDI